MRKRTTFTLFMGLFAGCQGELPERFYETYAQAVSAGEIDRGWLPNWIPTNATRIHIQNDVDLNDFWLRVDLFGATADSLKLSLQRLDPMHVDAPRATNNWWFECLIQQCPENDGGLNAELFQGPRDPLGRITIVAFDRVSNTVYVWNSCD